MVYFPSPHGLASAPLEGIIVPPSYKSKASDAPPPAYFPPSHSPSPQPPIYTPSGRPSHDANSHWARFPSSSPRPSAHKPPPSSQTTSDTENRRPRSTSRAQPGYIAGKLNPAPKRYRHRPSLQPDLYDARSPTSQSPQFLQSPHRSRSPSPCPPTHSPPSRIPLNVGVETELDTDAERRQQNLPRARNQYQSLADESEILIEERGRHGGWGGRYGDRWNGRGRTVAWCFAVFVSVVIVVAVVVKIKANVS